MWPTASAFHDIDQKLRCWGYPSHYPAAEHDVAWLRRAEWAFSLP
jgi:hypothetical protein